MSLMAPLCGTVQVWAAVRVLLAGLAQTGLHDKVVSKNQSHTCQQQQHCLNNTQHHQLKSLIQIKKGKELSN